MKPRELDTEITVIGGGVIGSTAAYYLAKAGHDVTLVECRDIATGPTNANSGVISLLTKSPGDPLRLAKKSRDAFPALIADLDTDVDHNPIGMTVLAETEPYWEPLRETSLAQQASGADIVLLDNCQLRELEPALAPYVYGGVYAAGDSYVNPMLFTFAVARAARRYGCKMLLRTKATAIEHENGRVTAVMTDAGRIRTKWAVNAAGPWAPEIGRTVGEDLPIVPRRGQVCITEATATRVYTHVRSSATIRAKHEEENPADPTDPVPGVALMPTTGGGILLGSTYEFAGYDPRVTAKAVLSMARRAVRLFPFVKDVSIVRAWAGLRPYPLTPGNNPIVGPSAKLEGYIVAAGHSGDGIALAPITGMYVKAMIEGKGGAGYDLECQVFVPPDALTGSASTREGGGVAWTRSQ